MFETDENTHQRKQKAVDFCASSNTTEHYCGESTEAAAG